MCRNIKTLFNFEPPATQDEIHAAAVQFVRKVAGTNKPAKANEAAFEQAVVGISAAVSELLKAMVTSAAPKDRLAEAAKAKLRSARRFAPSP